jgi:hypothetical protein
VTDMTPEMREAVAQAVRAELAAAMQAMRAEVEQTVRGMLADEPHELDEFDTGPSRRVPYFQDIQRGGGGDAVFDNTYPFDPGDESEEEIIYNPVPTIPEAPTPDHPEPYEGQEPEGGYVMEPRMVWVWRRALAVDVTEGSGVVEGQWLKSKRLVMCSQELAFEPTFPHVFPETEVS